jgi:hypothetical protein
MGPGLFILSHGVKWNIGSANIDNVGYCGLIWFIILTLLVKIIFIVGAIIDGLE